MRTKHYIHNDSLEELLQLAPCSRVKFFDLSYQYLTGFIRCAVLENLVFRAWLQIFCPERILRRLRKCFKENVGCCDRVFLPSLVFAVWSSVNPSDISNYSPGSHVKILNQEIYGLFLYVRKQIFFQVTSYPLSGFRRNDFFKKGSDL